MAGNGVRKLRQVQFGGETTAGIAVTATTIWRGSGTGQDERVVEFPVEDVGLISGSDRTVETKRLAGIQLDEVNATFEQMLHPLECGVKLVNTGATDGLGSDHIYTYPVATNALPTVKTKTIKAGDNQAAEVMEYGFLTSLTLRGNGGEGLKVTQVWNGRQWQPSTFDAPTLPAVEDIPFSKGKLYIDNVASSAGTTLKSATFLGLNMSLKTGLIPKYTADGNVYFSFVQCTDPEALIAVTFEHETSAVAEKAAFRAQTPRLIQITWQGSNLTTAGSSYSTKLFQITAAGKWEKFDKLGEQNGNDIVVGHLRARWDAVASQFLTFLLVEEGLATVP